MQGLARHGFVPMKELRHEKVESGRGRVGAGRRRLAHRLTGRGALGPAPCRVGQFA